MLISNDPKELQAMLDFVNKFALDNEFEFNVGKCKTMKFHRKCSVTFNLGGEVLEEAATYRYLGIDLGRTMHTNSRPSPFKTHFKRIERKTRARGMVARYLGSQRDGLRPKTALKLYTALCRPLLEYASPVIVHSKSNLNELEKLQNLIVKRSLGLRDNTKTASVRVVSGIPPLATRFAFLKLKHLRRITMKPESALVRVVYQKIRQQESERPGFLTECQNLCTDFEIDYEQLTNFDVETTLLEFGAQLKKDLYTYSFQRDLAAIKISNQASILASLFPPQSSYYSYRPLDLAIRVLHRENRTARTSFFQNLVGSSKLSNCIDPKCKFCKSKLENISHYLFDCATIQTIRTKFVSKISKQLTEINPHVSDLWQKSLRHLQTESGRKTACAILFGGNFAVDSDGAWELFRKTHYKAFHESDRTCIATARHLEKLGHLLDRLTENP